MDENLKVYLDNGNFFPKFMKGFHNQKVLFKRLQMIVNNREDYYSKKTNWVTAHIYTTDIFLTFMAQHGYTLQKCRKKIDFFDVEEDLERFKESNGTKSSLISMDKNLIEYLGNGDYLPSVMNDFHDQKDIFQFLATLSKKNDGFGMDEFSWVMGHVYIVDVFLWYMAKHGFTLQKCRKNLPFNNVYESTSEFLEVKSKQQLTLLQSVLAKKNGGNENA